MDSISRPMRLIDTMNVQDDIFCFTSDATTGSSSGTSSNKLFNEKQWNHALDRIQRMDTMIEGIVDASNATHDNEAAVVENVVADGEHSSFLAAEQVVPATLVKDPFTLAIATCLSPILEEQIVDILSAWRHDSIINHDIPVKHTEDYVTWALEVNIIAKKYIHTSSTIHHAFILLVAYTANE